MPNVSKIKSGSTDMSGRYNQLANDESGSSDRLILILSAGVRHGIEAAAGVVRVVYRDTCGQLFSATFAAYAHPARPRDRVSPVVRNRARHGVAASGVVVLVHAADLEPLHFHRLRDKRSGELGSRAAFG